jgi:hypothetical protein
VSNNKNKYKHHALRIHIHPLLTRPQKVSDPGHLGDGLPVEQIPNGRAHQLLLSGVQSSIVVCDGWYSI